MLQNCISEDNIGTNAFSKTVQILPIRRIGGVIGTELKRFEVVTEITIKLWK